MPTTELLSPTYPAGVRAIVDEAWNSTLATVAPRRPESASHDVRFRTRESLRGSSVLQFHDLALSCGSTLRATRIAGRQVGILNVMIFPRAANLVPIFASEIVAFGPSIRAAVIDLQAANPAWRHRLEQQAALRHAALLNETIPPGGPLPDWCAEYFTRHALWSRELPLTAVDKLVAIHLRYLDAWMQLSADQPHAGDTAALAAYKHHHIIHSPGISFLSGAFGADWTREFLREGMYA